MALTVNTDTRSGLATGFDAGDEGWEDDLENTLRTLATLALGGGVADRDLATPPVSPSDGDAYIVASSATGDWVGEEDSIAIYVTDTWVFYTPPSGFGIFIEDEDVWSVYKTGSGWSDGVSHSWT
jgi:hypothetical protein